MEGISITIFFYIISLFILYVVIETAVRRGINSSKIGQYLENEYEIQDISKKKKSFFDDDLDK